MKWRRKSHHSEKNFQKFTACTYNETVISDNPSRAMMHKSARAEGLCENKLKCEFLIISAEISMSCIIGRLVESNPPVK
jgi:hypothetical protein